MDVDAKVKDDFEDKRDVKDRDMDLDERDRDRPRDRDRRERDPRERDRYSPRGRRDSGTFQEPSIEREKDKRSY
jgi:hypothetical protein